MKLNFVRKELIQYINAEIKPLYKTFDKAHNIEAEKGTQKLLDKWLDMTLI